ncbi:hypothetical protein M413DRAFT_444066 [Hebeloma cylindrosporum]|uniref:Uncharacterized protein n=1 Tax=Hebeloma cylindrosporum TaxID=76867 RepID=A0A0C2YQH5_HEBCY|nr:hypothetical protein M413DRAFT_444066 [Hebeloma cylindrosporum h7]
MPFPNESDREVFTASLEHIYRQGMRRRYFKGRSSICIQDRREDVDIIDGLTDFNHLEAHGVHDSPPKPKAGYAQTSFRIHF